jgi:hypothetical protein
MQTSILPPELDRGPEAEAVALTAEAFVAKHQPRDYRLVVRRECIRYDRGVGRWFVVVQPDRDGADALDYARRLAAAQSDLNRSLPRHMRLVPVLPQELA